MADDPPPTGSISSTTSTVTIPIHDSIIPINIPIATKLSDTNFLTWNSQILPLLHGYNLTKFIETSSPNPTRQTTTGVLEINPEYLPWHRQDQLLLGWIRSSLSESIQAQVVSCTTTLDLWNTLHKLFSSSSRAHTLDLQRQVKAANKGTSSCSEFLQHLRRLADELAFAGSPLTDDELVTAAINGLGVEFNSIVAAITTSSRLEPFSFADLRGILLSHESLLKNQADLMSSSSPAAFNIGRGGGNRNRPPNQSQVPNRTPNYLLPNPVVQSQPTRPQFRPNVPVNNASKPVHTGSKTPCQICTKPGHPAKLCYFRYHPDPDWKPNPRFQAYNAQTHHLTTGNNNWVLDSGATNHVTNDPNNLSSFYAYSGDDTLQIGSGMGLKISLIGTVTLQLSHKTVVLQDVLYVPQFSRNLISISKLLHDNPFLAINFCSSFCLIKDHHTMTTLLQVHSLRGLFSISLSSSPPQALLGMRVSPSTWHARFGHPSNATTLHILNTNNLACNSTKLTFCNDCAMAKAHQLPFSSSSSSTVSPLELVHSDLWGPSPIVSSNGYKYYISFVDDFSRFTWIYFVKQKSDVPHVFSLFKSQVENALNTTIKTLRTDGGTEFKRISSMFPHIIHQTSCPYTPQQNGVVERKHKHIVELSLATMNHASIPTKYWDDIFLSIVYLINRLPSVNKKIPYTTLFNKIPDYSTLRILGCLCFPYVRPYNTHKLEPRAKPCVFIGYAVTQKGYKCLHLPTGRVFISRNVQFDEQSFPFKSAELAASTDTSNSNQLSSFLPLLLGPNYSQVTSSQPGPSLPGPIAQSLILTSPSTDPTATNAPAATNLNSPARRSFFPAQGSIADDQLTVTQHSSPTTAVQPAVRHGMTTRTKDKSRKPKYFPEYVAYHSSLDSEPTSFTKANECKEWREAMATELNALASNNTWSLVPPPSNQKIIGCKWVYKIKRKSDGSLDRYKARLVAKGFNQEYGVDFLETYSPVVRPTTVRLILSLAVTSHWTIRQLDVQNAFLHGDLQEKVYMLQPPGFIDKSNPDYVCLLHKSLYGLKQAPRAWFQKLSTSLINMGFSASNYDPSLFVSHVAHHTILVLVYVDDIIITGSDAQVVSNCISQLQQNFALKDLGPLHYFLGIEATHNKDGMHLTQTKYLLDLLTRLNMINAKPCATPMASGAVLSMDDAVLFDDPHLFRSVVGALQYATLTRPDLSFAVNKVSQYMHNPTINHWSAVKRILRYLCGTLNSGLFIHADSSFDLHAYSDADWAGSQDDRRSTSGFCIFLGKNIISWSAKKQPTVSRSSTEAEYRSLALTCTEILWLQYLMDELRITINATPTLWCDNIGATFLAANPMFHARTKHIEIDYHFVRERVASKQLAVKFLCSSDQIADIMTKPLPLSRFVFLRNKLTVFPTTLACGGRIESQSSHKIATEDPEIE
ncbi:polyprotein [Rhynchospora pubera]|uniref:Polyprotein n=1 Tax=Rhynchospora pubera TaxID=906938 RepID=A0AAV8BNE9_9POAL|nr:polyprotein [Rhynchospora pubera]